MNTLVIVLIAAVCLFGAYMLYGRWLANKWGIDPSAKTPAVVHEDGRDYVPTDGWTVFAHQFSSIAGAGPVTGAIQAAAFGWLPVLLWVLLGGIFFGAVTDFGALYASVKNDGKSMGMLIEKYIGKLGRKLFLLFCWLFCGIVIAALSLIHIYRWWVNHAGRKGRTLETAVSITAALLLGGAACATLAGADDNFARDVYKRQRHRRLQGRCGDPHQPELLSSACRRRRRRCVVHAL